MSELFDFLAAAGRRPVILISESVARQLKPPFDHIPIHTPLLTWDYVNQVQEQIGEMPRHLLAVGGGTVLDLAKILKSRYSQSVPLWTVPTTAGTGSEQTPFATVFRGRAKESVESEHLLPARVHYQPDLLSALNLTQRLSNAWDAFAHAFESLLSNRSNHSSRALAFGALPILWNYLRDPSQWDLGTIGSLQAAAADAGRAIAVSRTTLAHGFSYYLTAEFGWPHGFAVAINLPWLVNYTYHRGLADDTRKDLERVAEIVGAENFSDLADILEARIQAHLPCQFRLPARGDLVFSDWFEKSLAQPRSQNHVRSLDRRALLESMHGRLL